MTRHVEVPSHSRPFRSVSSVVGAEQIDFPWVIHTGGKGSGIETETLRPHRWPCPDAGGQD